MLVRCFLPPPLARNCSRVDLSALPWYAPSALSLLQGRELPLHQQQQTLLNPSRRMNHEGERDENNPLSTLVLFSLTDCLRDRAS